MSGGEQLLQKANKRAAASGGLFSAFTSSSSRYEEAGDLYASAGNAFKMDKLWKESGDAFCKAAEMSLKSEEKDDAANHFWTASKSYKKTHPELAVASLERTIQLYKEKGRFRQAADRTKEIASILQQEGGDLAGALEAFEAAGDMYAGEDAGATANGCYKEAAELAGTLGQYQRAVQLFEKVAHGSLSSALTRYSVKEYYLKAGMCWLASGDVVATQRAVEGYSQADPTFVGTREHKFIVAITEAFDAGDAEGFTGAVAEYDRLTKLDNWKTGILLDTKRKINDEQSLT